MYRLGSKQLRPRCQLTRGLRPSSSLRPSRHCCTGGEAGQSAAPLAGSSEPEAASTSGNSNDELPDALKGLQLTTDGLLIDERTGKEINDFGATRFDVAVRAMRGELDPPEWQENNERQAGIILQSLLQFPADYMFQVVGMPSRRQGCSKAQFVADMVSVVEKVCQEQLPVSAIQITDRMGGKYVSMKMTCRVRAPELVSRVFETLEGDERVTMKF